MKKRTKLTRSGLCGLLFLILSITLTGCFIFDDADEGTVTINLGGNTRAAAWGSKAIENYLDYEIELKGKITKTVPVKGGGTISFTVPTGSYDITINVKCYDIDYATGTTTGVNVKAGDNTVVVPMEKSDTTFYTVNNNSEWDNTISAFVSGTSTEPNKYCIVLTWNITAAYSNATFKGNTDVTIVGGKSITLSGPGRLFYIANTTTVTIKNVHLIGRSDNNVGLIYIDGGTFIMEGNSLISGNTGGSGVYMTNAGGSFIMKGGTIYGNTTTGDGGGVFVAGVGTGTFTMNGGTISDNKAGSSGGGVYVDNSAKFTMSGNASISNNEVTGGMNIGGGGVYLFGGTFEMSGGKISDNKALDSGSSGGGVYVADTGTFTMTKGAISGNNAALSGAQLCVAGGAGTTVTVGGVSMGTTDDPIIVP
ncbi:MAG: hypothetical protein FWG13_03015 [Leptospirales bacterium]|nr:hypothetical protein [Leptospirales bacterium]